MGEYTHERTGKHPISGDESRPFESLAEASGLLGWLVLRYFKDRPHRSFSSCVDSGPTPCGMANCAAENQVDSCSSGRLAHLGELIDC